MYVSTRVYIRCLMESSLEGLFPGHSTIMVTSWDKKSRDKLSNCEERVNQRHLISIIKL